MKRILILLCVAALIVNAGVLFSHRGWWPTGYYRHAQEAYYARAEKNERIKNELKFRPVSKDPIIRDINPSQRFIGYRFICHNDLMELLDPQGRQLRKWHLPFRTAWPDIEHIDAPVPDELIHCSSVHLYPNGDALEVFHSDGVDTPYGYGLAKMDKKATPLWTYSKHVHHDVFVAEDGRIYTLTQKFYNKPDFGFPMKTNPVLTDSIAILTPDGKELEEFNILQSFIGTPYEKLMRSQLAKQNLDNLSFDITHTNSVMALSEKMAPAFPMFKPGDILISMKHLDMIAVIDPVQHKAIWAMLGPWSRQHQARFQPDGTIMFFNNHYILGNANRSQLVVVDPRKSAIVWQFSGNKKLFFYSDTKGSGETLPNGNIGILSTDEGRLLEITPEGKLVWSFDLNTPISNVQYMEKSYFTPDFCADIGC